MQEKWAFIIDPCTCMTGDLTSEIQSNVEANLFHTLHVEHKPLNTPWNWLRNVKGYRDFYPDKPQLLATCACLTRLTDLWLQRAPVPIWRRRVSPRQRAEAVEAASTYKMSMGGTLDNESWFLLNARQRELFFIERDFNTEQLHETMVTSLSVTVSTTMNTRTMLIEQHTTT